jgi:hypothetical protein
MNVLRAAKPDGSAMILAPGGGYSRGAWGRGLAPAYGVQTTSCPDGTMATTAHGHSSVVRCIPI